MGIILGGITLSMARHFWALGEIFGTALYMFTGAIFPLDVLPAWLRPIGFMFPITYWLELARRALLEMTSIVGHFANSMGQRIAVSVRT